MVGAGRRIGFDDVGAGKGRSAGYLARDWIGLIRVWMVACKVGAGIRWTSRFVRVLAVFGKDSGLLVSEEMVNCKVVEQ